jgi:hypothetical protein
VAPQGHIALLGDSVFDNAAYTSGEPDVLAHLRTLLPSSWQATLLAEDGATISRLDDQLRHVPASTSHLIVSIGGNDALQSADLLSLPVRSSAEALQACATRLVAFERAYRRALTRVMALERWTAVCTIYNGALPPEQAAAARMGVALFDDVILRTATDLRADVLELRCVCTAAADYANPIEPSGRGGLKIARGIAAMLGVQPSPQEPARLWGAS